MERQAELRILRRVAAQDPEIGALIEGKIVDSPIDPEIFKLKQVRNFVELIGTSGRTFGACYTFLNLTICFIP